MEKEIVEIYYGVILAQDDKSAKISVIMKDKEIIQKLYPNAEIVEVHVGRKIQV